MAYLGTIARPRTGSVDLNEPTLPSQLAARAATQGGTVAVLHQRHGTWHRWTWQELDTEVTAVAHALVAHGVTAGERVLVAGANRPRLLAGLLAAQRAGALPVLVPQVGAGVQLAQAMVETAPRVALVADVHEVDALRSVPAQTVVYDDGNGLRGERRSWLMDWERFTATAASPLPATPGTSDPAVLVYVADKTDGFRAVTLSHDTLIGAVQAQARDVGAQDRIFAALPFGWGEPLLLGPVIALQTGASLGFFENDATVLNDLRAFSPTLLTGPASLFRRMRQLAWADAARAGALGRILLQHGLGFAAVNGAPNRLAAALVVAPTRDRLGLAQVRRALCHGEPIPPRIAAFWSALDIRLSRFIVPPELGSPDPIGPELAEERARLRGSPFVRDAWVVATPIGERAALVSLDGETVATWMQAQGQPMHSLESLGVDERVHALIADEIRASATAEAPITTYLLATGGFDTASGETTPEGWLRPAVVERAHAAALQRLRAGGGRVVAAAIEREMDWEHHLDPLMAGAFHGYGM